LDPDALACPHAYYDMLRAAGPAIFVDSLGAWAVTRYEDIRQVLANVDAFSNRYPTGPRYAEAMRAGMDAVLSREDAPATAIVAARRGRWRVLLTADPPLHDRQRMLVSRAFTPRQVARAEPQVQAVADRLITAFIGKGEVEVVSELAWPLPLEVIAGRLGIPVDDMPMFKRWSDAMAALVGNHSFSPTEVMSLLETHGEFYEYFAERLAAARLDPQDDVLGKLATARLPDGDTLSEDEQLGMLSQFLVAGHETTTNLISMSMLRLARDPELAGRIRANPALVPPFVEEVLRLESPSQGMFRQAKQDVEIGGVRIAKGEHVFLIYAAGNMDEEVFPCPADLDVERQSANNHLAFGRGTHYCLGAPLARQEARIALTSMLARMDDISIKDGATVQYSPSYFLHGLQRLDLTFTELSA
jgi:cytochrome P450